METPGADSFQHFLLCGTSLATVIPPNNPFITIVSCSDQGWMWRGTGAGKQAVLYLCHCLCIEQTHVGHGEGTICKNAEVPQQVSETWETEEEFGPQVRSVSANHQGAKSGSGNSVVDTTQGRGQLDSRSPIQDITNSPYTDKQV